MKYIHVYLSERKRRRENVHVCVIENMLIEKKNTLKTNKKLKTIKVIE